MLEKNCNDFVDLPASISCNWLYELLGTERYPLVIDVRRDESFNAAEHVLPAAKRARHTELAITGQSKADLGDTFAQMSAGRARSIVIYCQHGHNVSQMAAASLRARGHNVAWLEGGISAWTAAGLPVVARAVDEAARYGQGMIWVTRRRPKIDRIACPWFVRRFIDPDAVFLYVEPDEVVHVANEIGGLSFDTPDAEVTHCGEFCSFDSVLDRYAVTDPVLRQLADVVRGADTGRPELARECGGLLTLSLGLSILERDDHVMLAKALPLYDALYAGLRFASRETHSWPPAVVAASSGSI